MFGASASKIVNYLWKSTLFRIHLLEHYDEKDLTHNAVHL